MPKSQCKSSLNHEIHPSIPVLLCLIQAWVTICSGLSGTSLFVTAHTRKTLLVKSTGMPPSVPYFLSIPLLLPVNSDFLEALIVPAMFYPPPPELMSSGSYKKVSPTHYPLATLLPVAHCIFEGPFSRANQAVHFHTHTHIPPHMHHS